MRLNWWGKLAFGGLVQFSVRFFLFDAEVEIIKVVKGFVVLWLLLNWNRYRLWLGLKRVFMILSKWRNLAHAVIIHSF